MRHLEAVAEALGLSKEVDFHSFRSMHANLMRCSGARPKIARDIMGHNETETTLEIYRKTWWGEQANAVSSVVGMVMNSEESDETNKHHKEEDSHRMLFQREPGNQLSCVATGAPRSKNGAF